MTGQNKMCGAIFDMDGTLLDSMPMWRHCGERYLRRLNRTPDADLARRLNVMTVRQGAAYLRENYGLLLTDEEIQAGILRMAMDYYRTEAEAKAGAYTFLAGLRRAGISLAVATVTDRPCAEAGLARLKMLPQLAVLLTSSDTGTGKETPELYLRAAAMMATAPAQTFVFEDSLSAARTAKAAGFCTVGVYDAASENDQNALRAECDFYLRDMTDYAGFAAKAGL